MGRKSRDKDEERSSKRPRLTREPGPLGRTVGEKDAP